MIHISRLTLMTVFFAGMYIATILFRHDLSSIATIFYLAWIAITQLMKEYYFKGDRR